MKLYKYLIIDDAVKDELLKPYYKYDEPKYYLNNEKNNRIYFYENKKDIAFMSFKYQNVKTDIFENKPVWAYVIIDNNRNIINAIREHKNWSTDKDYKKPFKPGTETGRILVEDISDTRVYNLLPSCIRVGGILGAGNNGRRALTLQQLILTTVANDYKHKERNSVLYELNNSNIKIEKIHHRAHTFDNRLGYLEPMTVSAHRKVHSKWEKEQNDVNRPNKVELWESYSSLLYCDCADEDCSNCNAVLRISTAEQFNEFIKQITSDEYMKLQRKIVSPAFYRK
ncbi:hypothetical protein [Ruminiclostridium josui]|uniref:hypothetical protein n=1 Tax=Ruminiclostridium josui TaxID=1499 RepID=UPI000466D34D|nr:hypothetical protein [Ruminiclostridium josui]